MKNSFLLSGQGGDGKISRLLQSFPTAPFLQFGDLMVLPQNLEYQMTYNDGFIIVDDIDKASIRILNKFLELLSLYPNLGIIFVTNNLENVPESIQTRCYAQYRTEDIDALIDGVKALNHEV